MLPFLLIVALFSYFLIVGQAILSLLRVRFGVLWSWFLSPTLGMGVTILAVNCWSKWGQPVKIAGPWITIVFALASIAVLVWRRPIFPWQQLKWFLAILLFYLFYTGWPMFKFNFNWMSYANDDMANYTLAAERFLNNSYYFLPEQTALEGRDYSQHFWFMHALQQIRPGSELLVAWTCSITGLNPHQVFMPVIFSLTLLQLFSLGALAMFAGRYRKHAFAAVALLAISPLFTLGTLYQLIAQVGGISMLICTCSLMLRDIRFQWNNVLATALLLASIAVTYPEVAPFVGLSILVYSVWLRYTRPGRFADFGQRIVIMGLLTFLLIGANTYQFINTLILQSLGSAGLGAMADISQMEDMVLFPWTLVPSFLPMVFGLHAFGIVGDDPWISIVIFLGGVMFVFFLARVLISLRRGMPAAVLGIIMTPLGVYLFNKGQDFGLFKLGMFAQPIVAYFVAQIILWLFARHGKRTIWIAAIIYAVTTVPSHFYYVRSSLGDVGGGLSEVVGASEHGVAFKPPADVKYDAIESDITNVVSAKMLALYTRGTDTRFLSRNYMDNVANIAPLEFLRNPDPDFGDRRSQMLRPLHLIRWMLPDELITGHVAEYNMMPMKSIDNSWSETSIRHLDYQHPLFVALQTKYDHFNKFAQSIGTETGWREQGVYMFKPLEEVKDRLIFIHSEKGPHYYSSARFRASFFQREPEPISNKTRYFHGTGRYSMFEVLNPSSDKLRLMVDFTRTSLGGPRSALPPDAVVIGDDTYRVNFVGSGSARVFSQPLKPQVFEGLSYLTLDFGEDGKWIYKPKTGLMALYGVKYNLDDRKLVGFTRDISLISEAQYRAMKRPTKIAALPADLYNNPGLEYSGIFEDGWLGDRSFAYLAGAKRGDIVTFKGEIPAIPEFQNNGLTLVLKINGHDSEPIALKPGTFTIERFVPETSDITRIELQFSKAETYGTVDLRKISAFMNELSVHPAGDLLPVLQTINRVQDSFQFQGLDTDGWAAKGVSFHLPSSDGAKVLDLQLEIPAWAGTNVGNLYITIDGRQVYGETTTNGAYQNIKIPLHSLEEKVIGITAQSEFKLPDQDKQRSYRVTKLVFRDAAADERLGDTAVRVLPRYELSDVDQDGWTHQHAKLVVPSNTKATKAVFQIEFPGWASSHRGKFTFTLNGRVAFAEEMASGVYKEISIDLDPGRDNELLLEATQEFGLPPPDKRLRSYRIVKFELK